MQIDSTISNQILTAVNNAQHILIISHRSPDADTIGSNVALRATFEMMGKKVTSACIDNPPSDSSFLPYTKDFIKEFNHTDYNLIFTVDCGSSSQTSFLVKNPIIKAQSFIINIDHHHSNDNFGKINLVIPTSASNTLILHNLLKSWGIVPGMLISTALLYGLYYDTGSFMHSNTDVDTLESASELLANGARMDLIVKNLYKTRPIKQLKLWGRVLSNIKETEDKVVVSAVEKKDFAEFNAEHSDLSGIIDYLNMVKGSAFSTLISEDQTGTIRGSLRTKRDDINLSELAGKLGGGGHKKASGFTIKGSLKKETFIKITPEA